MTPLPRELDMWMLRWMDGWMDACMQTYDHCNTTESVDIAETCGSEGRQHMLSDSQGLTEESGGHTSSSIGAVKRCHNVVTIFHK